MARPKSRRTEMLQVRVEPDVIAALDARIEKIAQKDGVRPSRSMIAAGWLRLAMDSLK